MLETLRGWAPEWAAAPIAWLLSPVVLSALAATSLLLFVLTLVAVPWMVTRIPSDFFLGHERGVLLRRWISSPVLVFALELLKNAFGVVLLVAGLAMLVLPGQGLVTIFVATCFLDFPGKTALQRRVLRWPPALETVNRWRRRRGRAPLRVE